MELLGPRVDLGTRGAQLRHPLEPSAEPPSGCATEGTVRMTSIPESDFAEVQTLADGFVGHAFWCLFFKLLELFALLLFCLWGKLGVCAEITKGWGACCPPKMKTPERVIVVPIV